MSYRIYSAVLLSLSCIANAHEVATDDKFTPIVNVGGRYLHSQHDYPVARLNNALEAGQLSRYQQGNAFDYADVGLQARWTDELTTLVKGSYHGEDLGNEFAFEQVWLKYSQQINPENTLTTRLGRQNVALGVQNLEHSHQWAMAVEPLVMRASVGDGWRDDGVDLSWQHQQQWYAGLGLYNGDGFPSNQSSGFNAVSTRLGWQENNRYLVVSAARFDASGRATKQTSTTGHTHNQASCQQASAGQVCFAGHADVLVVAGQWTWPQHKTTLNGEAWLKQEDGRLFSQTGDVDYQGRIRGGWLMADYQFNTQFHGLVRTEILEGEHHLIGANASLLANEAGVAKSDQRPYRTGLGLLWTNPSGLRVSIEGHQEHINDLKNNVFIVRYQADLWPMLKTHLLD